MSMFDLCLIWQSEYVNMIHKSNSQPNKPKSNGQIVCTSKHLRANTENNLVAVVVVVDLILVVFNEVCSIKELPVPGLIHADCSYELADCK